MATKIKLKYIDETPYCVLTKKCYESYKKIMHKKVKVMLPKLIQQKYIHIKASNIWIDNFVFRLCFTRKYKEKLYGKKTL